MPSQEDDIQAVLTSGTEALSLAYETVRRFDSPQVLIRTSMDIHSLELGTLTPAQYRYVAQRTSQAEHLFERHLRKLLDKIPKFMEKPNPIEFFIIPAYGRMLKNGTLSSVLFDAFNAHPKVSASMICIELSADLLFEDLEPLQAELEKVRQLGIRIALTEVGDEFCPLLRLCQFPYDLAFLDPYAVSLAANPQGSPLEGLTGFVHVQNKKVFAPDVEDLRLLENLEQLGCDGYTIRNSASPNPVFAQEVDATE